MSPFFASQNLNYKDRFFTDARAKHPYSLLLIPYSLFLKSKSSINNLARKDAFNIKNDMVMSKVRWEV